MRIWVGLICIRIERERVQLMASFCGDGSEHSTSLNGG